MNPEIHPRMMAKMIALSRPRPTMTDQELEDGCRLAAKSGVRDPDGLIKVRDLRQPARARPLPPPCSANSEYRQREAHEKTGSVPNGASGTTGAGGDWTKSDMRALSLSRILLAGLSLALLQPLRAAPGQVTFTLSAGTVGAFDFDVVTLAVTQPDAPNSFTDAVVTGKFARESDAPFNKLDGSCDATCGSVFCVRLMPKAAGRHSFSGRYREADFERARARSNRHDGKQSAEHSLRAMRSCQPAHAGGHCRRAGAGEAVQRASWPCDERPRSARRCHRWQFGCDKDCPKRR